ncbi:MAG: hypothetical protein R3E89_12785 [Thiolinea sp.]
MCEFFERLYEVRMQAVVYFKSIQPDLIKLKTLFVFPSIKKSSGQ